MAMNARRGILQVAPGFARVFAAFLVLPAACDSPSKREPQPVEAPPPVNHSVQGAELRTIMARLSAASWGPWPQELEQGFSKVELADRQEALGDARRLADALAKAADEIPRAVAHARMSEADRRSFVAQVDTLRDQAQRLSEAASRGDENAMSRMLNAIDETCMSCHDRFRDFAGPYQR